MPAVVPMAGRRDTLKRSLMIADNDREGGAYGIA